MNKNYYIFSLLGIIPMLFSCKNEFASNDFTAYFGGEITNPKENFVYFCKGDEVLDTLYLNEKNRFFATFDSLAPGLYNFKHFPEYQYVYFDKNDSLMIQLNSNDFDNSLVFCGRGDEKNNFLIEMFLKNEEEKKSFYDLFTKDFNKFNQSIDSLIQGKEQFYTTKKTQINWNDDFDAIAKASYLYPYYFKKELYPLIKKVRTDKNISAELPKNYYDYRKKIDFNDQRLADFSPFIRYINAMLNNIALQNNKTMFDENSLVDNIVKLNIADTLISNAVIKNNITQNIAVQYILEDENVANHQKLIQRFLEISTDKKIKSELKKVVSAVENLKKGNSLPEVSLIDKNNNPISINSLLTKNTVIFFWTTKYTSHFLAAHKKAIELQEKYPDLQFIAINIDESTLNWLETLSDLKQKSKIIELQAIDRNQMNQKWALTKVHRTILMNKNKTIHNAFCNLFEATFEEKLP